MSYHAEQWRNLDGYTKVETYQFWKLTRYNYWYILIVAKDGFSGT